MKVGYVRFLSQILLVVASFSEAHAASQADISMCEKIQDPKRRGECFEKDVRKVNESKSQINTFIKRAKQEATRSFLDPDSAKFRNLFVTKGKSILSLCGEVNGKNSYGGYVGYRRFIQHYDTSNNTYDNVTTEPDAPKDEMDKIRADLFTMSWEQFCTKLPSTWRE